MSEDFFRVSFITLLCALFVIRAYFRIKYRAIVDSMKYREESRGLIAFRSVVGTVMLYAALSSIYPPVALEFQSLPLPAWLRTAGIAAAAAALVLLIGVHTELGSSFSTSVHVKEHHILVTDGVYRFIRHPMYVSYLVFFASTAAVSGNWLFGGCGLLIIASLMTVRLRIEERLLEERFGEKYLRYAAMTGRFVPKYRIDHRGSSAETGPNTPEKRPRRDSHGVQ